eukprot:TRINITY_DN8005_c0_g1_i1.p1 TRINITY_DN8005_c0_g1~~TRINITY_DN8005_c0_g1_i1.p1  ORF type:complete len:505 (-),score=81.05 TRINITY_DN8005_c0_g1_i1:99-1613(-)
MCIRDSQNSEEMIELSLKAGADPNQFDPFRRTPFHHAINCAQIKADASFEIERLMIKYQGNVNIRDDQNRSVLHYAFLKISDTKSRNCQNIQVMDIYNKKFDPLETISSLCTAVSNCDVNIQDQELRTPLHYAAICGAVVSSKYLIKKGAKLEIEDYNGNTALALAFLYKSSDMALLLMDAKSNINIVVHENIDSAMRAKGLKGSTYSLFKIGIKNGWQGILYMLIDLKYSLLLGVQDAISERAFNLARTLLYKYPNSEALLQTNNHKQTIMHIFAQYGQFAEQKIAEKIMNDLLSRGLTLTAIDAEGKTPLHYAFINKFNFFISRALELLKDNANKLLNQKDENLSSPVLYAIDSQMTEEYIAKLFEKYVIDINVKNKQGCNMLFYCIQNKYYNLAKNLILQGIYVNSKNQVGISCIYLALQNFRSIVNVADVNIEAKVDDLRSDYELITQLFTKNCDCNSQNENLQSIIHIYVSKCNELVPPEKADIYTCLLYTSPSPRDQA